MYRNSPFFSTKSGKLSPFDMGWRVCSVGECDLGKELRPEVLCSCLPGPSHLWTRNDTPSTEPGILPVTGHWVRHQCPGFALIYRGGFGVCQKENIWNVMGSGGIMKTLHFGSNDCRNWKFLRFKILCIWIFFLFY